MLRQSQRAESDERPQEDLDRANQQVQSLLYKIS